MTEEEVLKKLSEYGEAIKKMKSRIEELEKENAELKSISNPLDSEEILKAFSEIDSYLGGE